VVGTSYDVTTGANSRRGMSTNDDTRSACLPISVYWYRLTMVACLYRFLTTEAMALKTPCFIHAGLPIKQIEIKLSRIEHKVLTLFEETCR